MAIRYNSTTKTGDLDLLDNEGRGHRVRFGGAGTGNRVKTDINLELDPTCPDQLGIAVPSVAQADLTYDQNSVTYTSNAADVKLYTRAGDTLQQTEFQLDIVLKTRAAANVAASFNLNFTNYQNFDFIYITPFVPVYEEIKRGQPWVYNYDRAQYLIDPASVPEPPGGYIGRQKWHHGGYHVKHKTWKNHRQNSTYCIISVPKLTDALGNESWGSLSFNPATGVMTYVNDATFLATRTLPITLDPTFGDTTVGTDTFPMDNGRALVGIFTAPEAGTVDSIHFYSGGGTDSCKGVVLATSGGAPTGAATIVGSAVASAVTPAWRTSTCASEAITAVTYAIGPIANGFSSEWYKDASGGNDAYMDNSGGGMEYTDPTANAWSTTSTYDGQMNAYLTYTAGGGGSEQTATASKGILAIVGKTATANTANQKTAIASKGVLVFAGKTATVDTANPKTATASKGVVTFTGKTASVGAEQTAYASKGVLVFAGQTSTSDTSNPIVANASKGTLVFSGKTATADTNNEKTATASKGALVFTGNAASVGAEQTAYASKGVLVFAGKTATTDTLNNLIVTAQKGVLVFSGKTATADTNNEKTATASKGVMVFNGLAGIASTDEAAIAQAQKGLLVFSGLAASVGLEVTAVATSGAIAFIGKNATASGGDAVTANAGLAILTFVGLTHQADTRIWLPQSEAANGWTRRADSTDGWTYKTTATGTWSRQ